MCAILRQTWQTFTHTVLWSISNTGASNGENLYTGQPPFISSHMMTMLRVFGNCRERHLQVWLSHYSYMSVASPQCTGLCVVQCLHLTKYHAPVVPRPLLSYHTVATGPDPGQFLSCDCLSCRRNPITVQRVNRALPWWAVHPVTPVLPPDLDPADCSVNIKGHHFRTIEETRQLNKGPTHQLKKCVWVFLKMEETKTAIQVEGNVKETALKMFYNEL